MLNRHTRNVPIAWIIINEIVHFPDMFTNVSEHFNSPRHTIQDFSFMPTEEVSNTVDSRYLELAFLE